MKKIHHQTANGLQYGHHTWFLLFVNFPNLPLHMPGMSIDVAGLTNNIALLSVGLSILVVYNVTPINNNLNLIIHFFTPTANLSTAIVDKLFMITNMTLLRTIIVILIADFFAPSTDKSVRFMVTSPMCIDGSKSAMNNLFSIVNKLLNTTDNVFHTVDNSRR